LSSSAGYAIALTTPASYTISPRALTVTASSATKTYDGSTASSVLPTITSGAMAAGDSATLSQAFDTADVGTGKTLIPAIAISDGNGGNNYAVTTVNDTSGVILPRAIAIAPPPPSAPKSFGVASPAVDISQVGLFDRALPDSETLRSLLSPTIKLIELENGRHAVAEEGIEAKSMDDLRTKPGIEDAIKASRPDEKFVLNTARQRDATVANNAVRPQSVTLHKLDNNLPGFQWTGLVTRSTGSVWKLQIAPDGDQFRVTAEQVTHEPVENPVRPAPSEQIILQISGKGVSEDAVFGLTAMNGVLYIEAINNPADELMEQQDDSRIHFLVGLALSEATQKLRKQEIKSVKLAARQ